jgi:hypothetical protein
VGSPTGEAFSPRTRRQRRRDEFCVDNVVIPFSGVSISPRIHKDIVTPSWTEIGDKKININSAFEEAIDAETMKKRKTIDSPNSLQDFVSITTTIQVEEHPTVPGTGELIDFVNTNGPLGNEESVDSNVKVDITHSGQLEGKQEIRDSMEPKDDTKDLISHDETNIHVRLLSESKEIEVESLSSEVNF